MSMDLLGAATQVKSQAMVGFHVQEIEWTAKFFRIFILMIFEKFEQICMNPFFGPTLYNIFV